MAQNSLRNLGWHLNLSTIPDLNQGSSVNNIVKQAIDLDLRQIAEAKSSTDAKSKSSISGPVVVQIQKILNIAVPKDQSESSLKGNTRRLLLLTLTDGNSSYQAVEMKEIRALSMDTPPGTKLLLKNDMPFWKGFLQLQPSNVEVLGGHVAKLVNAWELSRQLGSRAAAMLKSQNQRQQAGPGGQGPPAFVPFGQRIPSKFDATYADNFRAMEVVAKDKTAGSGATEDGEETDEFAEQRQAAIAKVLHDQKKKQNTAEDSKLAVPDISQLSIASKPIASAPPKQPVPVAVASSGPDGDDRPRGRSSFGGRPRRGRGGYEDDYDTGASMGKPSKFSLFDVIQQQPGQEKLKLVAETAKLVADSERLPSTGSYSARNRFDDQSTASGGSSRGGQRGGHRGSRGGWRGNRGGSAGPLRSSFSKQPQLFREGSAASSRVDSVSPTSEGGRNGAGRDLPPRLKRHQQTSVSQASWAEDFDAQISPVHPVFVSKSRSSTSGGGRTGDFNEDDADEFSSSRQSHSERSQPLTLMPPLSSGPQQPALAAIYSPVVPSEAAYPAPESLIAFTGPGYAISPQMFAPNPTFVPNSIASPSPVTSSAAASVPSSQVVPNQPSLVNGEWRPGAYCYARWNDGRLYPAQIISVEAQSQSAVVSYYEYNEIQNVPLAALHPLSVDGSPAAAALPVSQPVVLTMLHPSQAIPPPPISNNQHAHQQQRNVMWPLLPAPPPFPGMDHFSNRLSLLPSFADAGGVLGVPMAPDNVAPNLSSLASAKENTAKDVAPEPNEKAVEGPSNDALPVETAVAAG